jgi:hypothetical protein
MFGEITNLSPPLSFPHTFPTMTDQAIMGTLLAKAPGIAIVSTLIVVPIRRASTSFPNALNINGVTAGW